MGARGTGGFADHVHIGGPAVHWPIPARPGVRRAHTAQDFWQFFHAHGIAIIDQGKSGITGLFSHVIVLGADGRTYRRVDLAEDRGARDSIENEWTNASAELSPNGRRLAIGHLLGGATEIPVIDLITGHRRDYPLGKPMAYSVLAWSLDGSKLAVLLLDEPDPVDGLFGGGVPGVKVGMLDLDSGMITVVPDVFHQPGPAMFGPSGRLFMLTTQGLSVIDFAQNPAGQIVHIVPYPMASGYLWSQDETKLVYESGSDTGTIIGIRTMDSQEIGKPIELALKHTNIAGWRGPSARNGGRGLGGCGVYSRQSLY